MEWLNSLIFGEGIAHSVLILSAVIAVGVFLGKVKVAGISLGVTWILFVGIIFSHFGMQMDPHTLHFVREFGLILFVYSIGLQVGPGFFSSFKKGGIRLNMLASAIVLLGVATAYALHLATGIGITTMVGILSGAVTNTPGLGAAQQTFTDMTGGSDETIALGYAVAYPLGVVGIILAIIFIRWLFRIRFEEENKALAENDERAAKEAELASVLIVNPLIDGQKAVDVKHSINRPFVVSRVLRRDGRIEIVNAETVLREGDKVLVVASAEHMRPIINLVGKRIEMSHKDWEELDSQFISRRIIITKPELNGKRIGDLKLRKGFGVTVTRVNRAGVDLIARHDLQLQMGDRLTVVGSEMAIKDITRLLGNSMLRLREPNLIPIFIGICLGVLLGSIPFVFPGVPQPIKLGLAGGPLVVSILISRFGPHYKLVTYTTMSANLMLREIGISLFLACVGLGAGDGFVRTIVYEGGYHWIGYGFVITVVPILLVAVFARKVYKTNYYTLMGLIAGSMTDPPALAYSNALAGNDMPAVSYATVYPLTMFLRVLTAQLLIIFAVG